MTKISKILLLIANKTFTFILWLAIPTLILLDLYRPYLIWTTFNIFTSPSYNLFWFQLIGMIIFSTGLILLILARLVIKARHAMPWAPRQKGEGFAHGGIYSRIRHPIYSAIFLFLIGYSIWFQSWLSIICFVLSLILIKSALAEENWLLNRFGDEYREYMKQTGRFFPKL